jgi:hypothetical protein
MSETLTQRVAPVLERFEVIEWQGDDVHLSLRDASVEVKATDQLLYRSGKGPEHVMKIHAFLAIETQFGNSMNKALVELRKRLVNEITAIDDYLEWAAEPETDDEPDQA